MRNQSADKISTLANNVSVQLHYVRAGQIAQKFYSINNKHQYLKE